MVAAFVGLALALSFVVAVSAAQTFEEALWGAAGPPPPAGGEMLDLPWDDAWVPPSDDLCDDTCDEPFDEFVMLGGRPSVVVNVLRPAPAVPLYVPKRKDGNGAAALLTAR